MVSEVERLRQRWADADEHEINEAVAALLLHRHGRRLLWWLLQVGRWGTQPFTADPLVLAFNCGELNIGQVLADRIISVSPDGFVAMMKENADERSTRDTELGNARDADDARDAGQPDSDA